MLVDIHKVGEVKLSIETAAAPWWSLQVVHQAGQFFPFLEKLADFDQVPGGFDFLIFFLNIFFLNKTKF